MFLFLLNTGDSTRSNISNTSNTTKTTTTNTPIPTISEPPVIGGVETGGNTNKRSNEFKSCEIYINCDTGWDELQIIISRSTATDLTKMVAKLHDFFDQQHRSGIRALHTLNSTTMSQHQSSSTGGAGAGYFSRIPSIQEDTDSTDKGNEPGRFL